MSNDGSRYGAQRPVRALAECRAIETLRLNSDGLTPAALDGLRSMAALRKLALGDAFGDTSVAQVNRLVHLEALELSENVTDEFLNQLDRLPQLTELALRGPNVTDATARLLAESAPNLKTLYLRRLSNAKLTERGIRWISELSDLEVLSLDETQVGDDAILHLAELEKLRWLDLTGADNVTDESLKTIGRLRKMRMLFLLGTAMTSEGLEHLRGLENLRHLDLQSTKVTAIPRWLEARPMLTISLN